jgi:hypothetical protein
MIEASEETADRALCLRYCQRAVNGMFKGSNDPAALLLELWEQDLDDAQVVRERIAHELHVE